MATNKAAGDGAKPEPVEPDVKQSVLASAAASVKVVTSAPALKTAASVPIQPAQPSSAPVVLVTKVAAPGGQVTKATLTPGVQISPSPSPARAVVITVPRAAAASPQTVTVAPRPPQTTTTQLPANFQIPPGMMLIRSDSGQLMLVSQQALAQAQKQASRASTGPPRASTGPPTPKILTPPPTPSPSGKANDKVTLIRMGAPPSFQTSPAQKTALVKVVSAPPKPTVVQTVSQPRIFTPAPEPKKEAKPAFTNEVLESVKKCKNFLVTLIKLASSDSRSADMANNVKLLVKSLLEGKLEAEEFTEQLYKELKSTPQPCLVPFLKKSLPAVRILTPDPLEFIQQAVIKPSVVKPIADSGKSSQQLMPPPRGLPGWVSKNRVAPKQTGLQPAKNFTGTLRQLEQPRSIKGTTGSYKEDDDINDVASMAGVNLREENAQSLTTQVGSVVQSCQDRPFLAPSTLLNRILQIGEPLGVTAVGPEVVELVSHATRERLHTLLEKLTVMALLRKNLVKDDLLHSKVSDVRAQLKFLEDVETMKKKKKDQEEKERLLRLARSRSHIEDPVLLQLMQKAKELQQLEQTRLMQREANLAALAAIGPRKKRSLEQLDGQVCVLPRSSTPRATRIILRDLLQCMEQERSLRHSLTLYKAML